MSDMVIGTGSLSSRNFQVYVGGGQAKRQLQYSVVNYRVRVGTGHYTQS